MNEYRKLLLPISIAFVLLLAAVFLFFRNSSTPSAARESGTTRAEMPSYTPAVDRALKESKGFQALISYTDNGFEPAELMLKKGETARFTNNSSHELWVAASSADGSRVYPGSSDCGASALDTCKALKPKEFWESTFTESGTWLFRNNFDKGATGVARVQVQ